MATEVMEKNITNKMPKIYTDSELLAKSEELRIKTTKHYHKNFKRMHAEISSLKDEIAAKNAENAKLKDEIAAKNAEIARLKELISNNNRNE